MTMAKSSMTIKCTSVAAHFDGLGDELMLCSMHHLMQHVEGYSGSHWTPPLGDYSLRITPAAAWAKANKTTMKTCTNFAGHFNGCGGALVQYPAHHLMEEVQGFTRSHWMLPLGKYYVQ
jgi:hypothetical protein